MERPTLITGANTGQNKAGRGGGAATGRGGKRGSGGGGGAAAAGGEANGGRGEGTSGRGGGGGAATTAARRGGEGAAAGRWRRGEGAAGRGGGGGRGGRGGGGAATTAAGGGEGAAAGRWRRGEGAAGRGGGGGAATTAAGRGGEGAAAGRWRRGEGAAGRGTVRGMGGRRGESWHEKRDGVGDRHDWNEGRSHSAGRLGAPQGRGLGYNTLRELSEKDPSLVAITLSANPALKEVLSGTEMRQDLIELLCLVLSKAFKSQADRCTLQHLAGIIKVSGFFRTILPHYLGGMGSEFNAVRRADYPQHLQHILTILSKVLSTFPASSAQAASLLLTLLKASINNLKASGVDIEPQTEDSVENLEGLIKHLQERSREGTLRSDKDTYALLPTGGEEMPGEDFRTIPIYPTAEEFQQEQRPFLRPNLTSQSYTNTHLYLDTHFRLLREDFVRPLREGIQELLRNQEDKAGGGDNPLKKKQFDDIRVYFDTKLVVPRCTSAGIAYIVQFNIQSLKFVRWQSSKRLIYGSLVCLSCDNFETFLYATVSDRDPKTLEKGLVQIAFTEESRTKLARYENDQLFLMVETTAYFEAYRYVLEGLKEQEEDNLPFQRYIVECNRDVQPPAYLQISDDYDLSSVAHPDHKRNVKPFHSLEARAWPKKEELGLDESQMRAFQLALTKELTIIQGPPGTGKTYVGLKIAQALLTNQELWQDELDKAPMLVVCYTNHALDQFLEGIHKFLPNGIVRVGGRSNSEILKRFNLRELTHSPNFKRTLPSDLQRAYNQLHRELCEEERGIQIQSVKLECSLKGILRENYLQSAISDTHWESLHQQPPTQDGFRIFGEKKSSLIMEWLGLGSTVFLQRETENANKYGEEESQELDDGDDLIDIAEEADLMQEERFIEDGSDPRGGRKNGDMEEAVRAVEELMLAMNLDTDEIQAEQSEGGVWGGVWEIQKSQKKKLRNRIRRELGKSSAMTEAEENVVLDIWTLSQRDRWRLYRLWVARYRVKLRTIIQQSEEVYQNAVDRLADVKRHEHICLLTKATVIGMTTTGAAKFRSVLQIVAPRLVIVEEAAEVLEAHTITTLSKACQHLILIGDHQQLRPSATVYELAKNFNLEVSMFERLVKMELPYVRLDYQHRMRPEIACLLTPHIYAELENHPSVLDYDNIKGLDTNLFFVEHTMPEEEIKDGKSHQNKHEASFVVSLCRYLICQGYKPEQITILTTYTGQLYCLRNLMPADQFTGVKVHVVDKYQGEENDIVLLSLVRSNRQGKVGFLSIPNRVCVALSRAKKGLYCIGNSAMLSQVKLWSNIFHTLRKKDQIGSALTLYCQNHPERKVKAANADDFQQAPEGGCIKPCEFRLDCGHVCTRACHPYDPEHKKYQCIKKCQRIVCDLGHRCKVACYQECPKCSVMVEKNMPRCQHTGMAPCHVDPERLTCQVPCTKLLQCGHPCASFCGEPCTSRCIVKITLELECGHSQQEACFSKAHTQEIACRTPCKEQLKCGHACTGSCSQCFQGRFHSPCLHKCDRLLICSHRCREPCTRNCPPCERPCENCCVHSKCTKPCGLPCAPCIEPCTWRCPHQSCSKLCHEPCDRLPCNQPCAKTLDCGHQCIGLCGDKCPSKCRICHRDEVTEIFFGTEDEPEAFFIQLEDCGHIIEYTAMDQYMGMDANQQASEEEDVGIKLKECPKCKTPIRKNLRYGSHINRCLAEIEMVKDKINGCQANIEEHRKTLENQWADNSLLMEMLFPMEYVKINARLKRYVLVKDLLILENQMGFLIKLAKLKKIQNGKLSETESLILGEHVMEFVRWLNYSQQRFTEQQVFDLQSELQRITLLTELHARCHKADMRGQSAKIQSEVQTITEVLKKCGQFTEQDQLLVREAMKELDKRLPPTGLGINEEEKKMIVSALQMQPGHWYKCPNGHVYIITECGGATVSRQCTDCEATIGGANHTLASGNQVASEMDGAQHSAWSDAFNLQNFNLNI